jgi:hypothetical protein
MPNFVFFKCFGPFVFQTVEPALTVKNGSFVHRLKTMLISGDYENPASGGEATQKVAYQPPTCTRCRRGLQSSTSWPVHVLHLTIYEVC